MDPLFIMLALAAGAALPIQAGVNNHLRSFLGRPEWAAVANFGVGFVALLVWVLIARIAPTLDRIGAAPWWSWTGGLLGAFFVTMAVFLTPRLGVAAMIALVVAGQMGMAVALDHFGAMGLAQREVTPVRLVGGALLVAGVVLLRR